MKTQGVSRPWPTNVTPEQLEELGRLVDQASNLVAASQLPVRPEIHIEGMRSGLLSIGEALRSLYIEITGDDPWG